MKHSALSIASRPFVGKALLASLALAGALLLPAQSAVVTATVDPLEPTENILLNTNAIGANLAWNGQGTARAKGHRNVGQSFLATQNAGLESVVFHINDITPAEQALNAAFTLQIFSVTGPAVLPSTAALYTGQGTLPAAMAGNDWLTFKLDSPFQLTAGAYYAVMLSFNDPLTGHSVSLISSPTDTAYANGMGIFYTNVLDNGPLAYVRSMSDFEMILIIPEASSMAMLALGAGLLLVVPRWRRRAFTTTATAAVLIGVMNDPLPAKAEGDTAHTIVLLGDSTVETQKPDSPLQGWGAMLQGQTKAPWQIVNCALSGASTKTFKETPRWQKALATPCRYWFVQFGHNDSHAAGRPESTDAATTYKENLRFYVQEARTRKITPVLVTPMHRLTFQPDGSLRDILLPYATAVKEVAKELDVAVIDLFEPSGEEFLKRGPEGGKALFAPNDPTHFNPAGAEWFASLVATQAATLDSTLASAFKATAANTTSASPQKE